MQDYGRAVIIGEQTFGKGTVQRHKGLGRYYDMNENPLGSIQFTTAKFYRISGGSTQHVGVIPDILYPSLSSQKNGVKAKKKTHYLMTKSIVRITLRFRTLKMRLIY